MVLLVRGVYSHRTINNMHNSDVNTPFLCLDFFPSSLSRCFCYFMVITIIILWAIVIKIRIVERKRRKENKKKSTTIATIAIPSSNYLHMKLEKLLPQSGLIHTHTHTEVAETYLGHIYHLKYSLTVMLWKFDCSSFSAYQASKNICIYAIITRC